MSLLDDGRRALRVNTVELRRNPGLVRDLEAALSGPNLEVDDPRLRPPVEIRLRVASTIDGLVVTGHVTVEWADTCRRCLADTLRSDEVEVDELYQEEVVDPDAYELGPDALDLHPMVRDLVLLVLADPPTVCRPDCAGICPVCGVDRNLEACGCDTEVRDERWAALEGLRLDDDPDSDPDADPDPDSDSDSDSDDDEDGR